MNLELFICLSRVSLIPNLKQNIKKKIDSKYWPLKSGVAKLILDKIEFKAESIKGNKEEYFMLIT